MTNEQIIDELTQENKDLEKAFIEAFTEKREG
jgi:hypothetical protein